MSWLPKSPKARRRLTLVAAIAPVLALAVGLALGGLGDSISIFYTPSQAATAKPKAAAKAKPAAQGSGRKASTRKASKASGSVQLSPSTGVDSAAPQRVGRKRKPGGLAVGEGPVAEQAPTPPCTRTGLAPTRLPRC